MAGLGDIPPAGSLWNFTPAAPPASPKVQNPPAAPSKKKRRPPGSVKAERAARAAGFAIIADTREKVRHGSQYTFECCGDVFPVYREKLDVGDYSIFGLEDRFAIERKSHADAWATFGGGRERFERELERSRSLDYFGIIIESTLRGLRVPPRFIEQVTPATIINSLISWSIGFKVFIWLADDRMHAEFLTFKMAQAYYRRAIERGWIAIPELPMLGGAA